MHVTVLLVKAFPFGDANDVEFNLKRMGDKRRHVEKDDLSISVWHN